MSSPDPNDSARALLDPGQHVRFARGMVLGTHDFNQEFAYLSGHDQWTSRGALGYGTVSGLDITLPPPPPGGAWEVQVAPGAAITPAGQWVRVPGKQCADLAAWILAHQADLARLLPTQGDSVVVSLRVMLGAGESLSDPVPVLGDTCDTTQDILQPSRINDHFRLALVPEAASDLHPAPREEQALRQLVHWLREQIRIVDVGAPPPLDTFLDHLRAAARSSDFVRPADPATPVEPAPAAQQYELSAAQAEDFVRQALRVWVVELRPRWHPDRFPERPGPRPEPPTREDVLLAVVEVPLARSSAGWILDPDLQDNRGARRLRVDQSRRPWLLHLRALQELVLQHVTRSPGAPPELLSFDVNFADPGAPADPAPAPAPTDAVIRPDGVRTYQIVVAGVLPLREGYPVVGTSNLRINLRHAIPPSDPDDLHHALLEFTYDGHDALFQETFNQPPNPGGWFPQAPDLWPSHGFIVKANLLTLPESFIGSNRHELQTGGLASLLAAPNILSGLGWDWNNPVTVAVELVAATGITLRVSSRRPLYYARLLVEVSWCDRFRP